MADSFIPPVVISIVLNEASAQTQMKMFTGSVAGMAKEVDASLASITASAERMDASFVSSTGAAAVGATGMKGALAGIGESAVGLQAQLDAALANETPYSKAVRAADNAEKDISGKTGGFASRMGNLFGTVGNSMGRWGIPFSGSVKKMGTDIQEAEAKGHGFSASLMQIGKAATVVGGLLVAGLAVMAVKAADQFDVAKTRLATAIKDVGGSYQALEPQINKTYAAMEKFGHGNAETADSLAKLTVSTKDPVKAMGEMETAANLAAFKNISLAQATETLVKVNAGSNRALIQLGINLDVGTAKLATIQKATEAVTKARTALKTAEEAVTAAVAKAGEEHKAALEKVTAAEATLKGAQETLKGGTEGVTAAQNTLKEAYAGVAETAKKERDAVKEAAAALKSAEESAAEAAQAGSKNIESAKENLSALEQERVKESNEASIKTIEAEEKTLEATKTTASEGELVQLRAKKAQLEGADKAMEAIKKEGALQKAHESIIEAEATAHKNNAHAMSAVEAAHKKLIEKQKEDSSSSAASVAAANKVAAAQKGVSAAERTLAHDHEAVAKAAQAVSAAQEKAAKSSTAVTAAEAKLKTAHENLSKAEKTLHKDATTTQKVMEALSKYLGGQAAKRAETITGKWEAFTAVLNHAEVNMGSKLLPVLAKLGPALGIVTKVVVGAIDGFVKLGEDLGIIAWKISPAVIKAWNLMVAVASPLIGAVKLIVKALLWLIETGWKVVKFFVMMPVQIVKALAGLVGDMAKLGEEIVTGLVHGIEHAPGAVVSAIKGLIPGGIVGEAAEAIGLAAGGIVTKPTLAVVGEAGPEMVVPLKGVSADRSGVQPLGTPSSSPTRTAASTGAPTFNLTVNGAGQTEPELISNLYLRLRPLLQGA